MTEQHTPSLPSGGDVGENDDIWSAILASDDEAAERAFVSSNIYLSAVKGRQDFRTALRETRAALTASETERERMRVLVAEFLAAHDAGPKIIGDSSAVIGFRVDRSRMDKAALKLRAFVQKESP